MKIRFYVYMQINVYMKIRFYVYVQTNVYMKIRCCVHVKITKSVENNVSPC